jgi:hypothetical protein
MAQARLRLMLLVGIASTAACGSTATTTGSAGTPAPVVAATQPGTAGGTPASSTGSPYPKSVIGQYAALAATLNAEGTALDAKYDADLQKNDLQAVKGDILQGAQQYQAVLAALQQISFPTSVQTDVNALIKSLSTIIQAFTDAGNATSQADLNAMGQKLFTDGANLRAAVNVVLADLGLPPG